MVLYPNAPDHAGRPSQPVVWTPHGKHGEPQMTIAELIAALSALDPDLLVVIRSYEDGLDRVRELKPCTVYPAPGHPWYSGELQKVYESEYPEDIPPENVFAAIELECGNRE